MNKTEILEKHVLDPSLKLWLPLAHMEGPAGAASLRSHDAYGLSLTPTGAFWTPDGWYFDGVDDEITGLEAVTSHLDFTTEDYSVVARIRYNDNSATQHIVSRFQWNQSGWALWLGASQQVQVYTFQAGVNQQSLTPAGTLAHGGVYTIGFSRQGASIRVYVDGVDVTVTAASHVDNVTANRKLGIGHNGYAASVHLGLMKAVAIWQRWLSPAQHADMHHRLTEVFG